MSRFEVGDKVRCIDTGGYDRLEVGNIYEVTSLWDSTYYGVNQPRITGHTLSAAGFNKDLFELYRAKAPKKPEETVGMKFDDNKLQYNLLSRSLVKPLACVAAVLTYGCKKYEANGWQGVEAERYEAALDRHLASWRDGEQVDPDTGIHHLAHAATNVLFLLYFEVKDTPLPELGKFIDPTEQYKEERERCQD